MAVWRLRGSITLIFTNFLILFHEVVIVWQPSNFSSKMVLPSILRTREEIRKALIIWLLWIVYVNLTIEWIRLELCALLSYRALHLTAGLSNASDLLELLLSFDADVDAMNDDLCSPLFYAAQANNLYAASLLLNQGKNFW